MKNAVVFIFTLFLIVFKSVGQTQAGDLEAHLNAIVSAMPGSGGNEYIPPSPSEITDWKQLISDVLGGNTATAQMAATGLGYDLISYTDTVQGVNTYYLLEEKLPKSKFWGTYVFNPNACRSDLVLQATHPKYDSNTGLEAIFCFTRLSAKALFLSGTHRCNHDSLSICSGTTSACGSASAFRISDMAHNATSIFQATTEATNLHDLNHIFVQLHGFSMQASDPFVIMSNGSRDTPSPDYCALIRDGLLLADTALTFKIGHIDTTWTRLLAFTNTQGRFLNGSANPCTIAAAQGSGKFIHIEQERARLRADSTGWNKVYQALSSAFTCTPPVGNDAPTESQSGFASPNPNQTGSLKVKGKGISDIQLIDLNGSVLVDRENFDESDLILDISGLAKGVYFLRMKRENGYFFQKVIIQ